MSQDTSSMLALKNAWNGAIAASDRLRELAPSVETLGEGGLTGADLERFRNAALAQAIAAQALRGLLEELQRHADGAKSD